MIKRCFDLIISLIALLLLSPVFIIVSIFIIIDSGWPVFYKQSRVGKNDVDFKMFKFRSMVNAADKKGLLTVGMKDNRITKSGYYLRKYKLDELPQLINVLIGNMSIVGPRPEVRKYTSLYNQQQKEVLTIKPGITDFASIEYARENELLSKAEKPEEYYIEHIMPVKLEYALRYKNEQSLLTDIKIIARTIRKIWS